MDWLRLRTDEIALGVLAQGEQFKRAFQGCLYGAAALDGATQLGQSVDDDEAAAAKGACDLDGP